MIDMEEDDIEFNIKIESVDNNEYNNEKILGENYLLKILKENFGFDSFREGI